MIDRNLPQESENEYSKSQEFGDSSREFANGVASDESARNDNSANELTDFSNEKSAAKNVASRKIASKISAKAKAATQNSAVETSAKAKIADENQAPEDFADAANVEATNAATIPVETSEDDAGDELLAREKAAIASQLEEVEAADSEILSDETDESAPTSSTRTVIVRSSSNEEPYATTAAGTQRHIEFDRLFREWRSTGDPKLRDRLILMNRGLVAFVARKFIDRGEMYEDLMQQGLIGLINALDHFDPKLGARFVTFATPTIMGEMHRYLRDKTWALRVPRRLHELNHQVNQRIEALTQQFDRSPTYVEIAQSLGVELEEVIEALEMMHAVEPVSIDEVSSQDDDNSPMSEQLGVLDPDLENWNEHASLQIALEKLEPRERRVLQMVYFQGHSQLEVSRAMNVSQMNISRLQRRALNHLREFMSNEP